MSKISVIIPVYKVEKYLDKCVQSVINQTYKDLEIILVDDGSLDNCSNICNKYAEIDKRVKVIHKENGGLSDARNAGLKIASGEYIGFVDSDDYISEYMYEKLYELIINNNADVSCCGVSLCTENSIRPQAIVEQTFVCNNEDAFKYMLEGKNMINIWVWCKLYKREIFNKISFAKDKRYEDVFFMNDLIPIIKTVAITTHPYYYYVNRYDSITGSDFITADIDIITAYEICRKTFISKYPNLKRQIEFRYIWSHFYILDKMILNRKKYKKTYLFKYVVRFLRKNFFRIMSNSYFTKERKLSEILLFIGSPFYKQIVKIKSKHH